MDQYPSLLRTNLCRAGASRCGGWVVVGLVCAAKSGDPNGFCVAGNRLVLGSMAYLAVRAGDIVLHQQWMIRSYALTLAAVTLRLQLGVYQQGMGLSFDESYDLVAWSSWIPNLIIAEWLFNQAPIGRSARAS